MVERGEETQPVISLEQSSFDLHLPARQWPAGCKALWAGQELRPGFDFVSDHLKALLSRIRSCAHTMGLCEKAGSDISLMHELYTSSV